ncbi:MAG: ABC transporter ATP-binding protein, partial [Lentisphaeraceae bacterium]|nr:ABC transporter ATP-binding protein [Lentisphaeraceae bacterium]
VCGRLTECYNGVQIIRGFNAEKNEEAVFEKGAYSLFEKFSKVLIANSLLRGISLCVLGAQSAVMMYSGSRLIQQGSITIGDFFSFILYLGFMLMPILQMTEMASSISSALAGVDRVQQLLCLEQEGAERENVVRLGEIKGDLLFDKVSFSYEQGDEVLHDVSFSVPPGKTVALVGSSGSGKSTIASLAASFLQTRQGSITIDGVNLADVEFDSYRSNLGMVLQDPFLFAGTIRENLLMARPQATEEEMQQAIEAAHVVEFVERLKDGLETVIGERGVRLSGGQQQRIAIARTLLADPRILILDEATSNLDTESEACIQESLARLMKGRTVIVIAHRLSTIRQADEILVLEQGRIVERGHHDELIDKQGRYHQLFTMQAKI